MPTLIIGQTPIDFPNDAASPDYAPAIIQFAEAVTLALANVVNPFDVAPQSFPLDAYNTASNIDVPVLSFPTSSVRAVFIRYSVYRTTSTSNAYEAGTMIAIYNANNSIGSKWAMSLGDRTGGDGQITFNITDTGQFQFSTTALSGSSHVGKFVFEARALAQ